MADWKTELWKSCKEVEKSGGEIVIVFNKRNEFKRVPTIRVYKENYIVCDETTILPDD